MVVHCEGDSKIPVSVGEPNKVLPYGMVLVLTNSFWPVSKGANFSPFFEVFTTSYSNLCTRCTLFHFVFVSYYY